MESPDISSSQQTMRTRSAFFRWAICLAILVALISLNTNADSSLYGDLAFIFYFAAGVYLNRSVLRRLVEWHPIYNTLGNVTSDKLRFFLLWPITYFFLFVRLGINKIL